MNLNMIKHDNILSFNMLKQIACYDCDRTGNY